jgi:hypothetical protein
MFKQGHSDTTSPRRARRAESCSRAPCRLGARASRLPNIAARLPNAPHPYGSVQCPAVRRPSSGRERPETPSSVHRSLVGTRIDYKRPSPPASRTGTAGLHPPGPPPAPVPLSGRVVLSLCPTPHCRLRPSHRSYWSPHRRPRGSPG